MSNSNICNAILIGNIGQDPKIGTTNNGKMMAKFSVATTDELTKETMWHNIICFGKLAEIVESYAKKGDKVYIEGSIVYSKYTDKNDIEKMSTSIRGRTFKILFSAKKDNEQQQNNNEYKQQDESSFDDDIPF